MKAPGIQLYDLTCDAYSPNTVGDRLNHAAPCRLTAEVNVTANNESIALNVFKFTNSLIIENQWARIIAAPDLTNCTNVFATGYDGTTSVNLTSDGVTLSGVPVGTFFSKTLNTSQPYTLLDSSSVEVYEPAGPKVGQAFMLNAKNGVDNFIRFHLTTNTTLDFTMYVSFEYRLFNGATLEFA
jgi:hypothetical protein